MVRSVGCVLLGVLLAAAGGCRRAAAPNLNPVRALRDRVEARFEPPPGGQLTAVQVDLYLRVRRASGGGPDTESARVAGADPAEFHWVRGRIVEALQALEAKQVAAAAAEQYARALLTLREARRGTRDPRAAAELDAQIAGLERERAALRKADPSASAVARNAILVAQRRAEIESVGP